MSKQANKMLYTVITALKRSQKEQCKEERAIIKIKPVLKAIDT